MKLAIIRIISYLCIDPNISDDLEFFEFKEDGFFQQKGGGSFLKATLIFFHVLSGCPLLPT